MNNNKDSKQPTIFAIYTRKSSEEGLEQEFNSLDSQHESCKSYITSQKHEGFKLINKRYDDVGYSGGNTNRPALQQLITDINNNLINCIVSSIQSRQTL